MFGTCLKIIFIYRLHIRLKSFDIGFSLLYFIILVNFVIWVEKKTESSSYTYYDFFQFLLKF